MSNSDIDVSQLLKVAFESDLRNAPRQHRLRTPNCPSLPLFAPERRREWTAEKWGHASSCPYCQKVLAMVWHTQCPSLFEIVWRLGDPSGIAPGLKAHLDRDHCTRCRRLVSSNWLKSLGELLREGKRGLPDLAAFLVNGGARVQQVPQEATGSSEKPRPPVQLEAQSEDGLLTVKVFDFGGDLFAQVTAEDSALAGRQVHLEILGEGKPLEAEAELEMAAGRCRVNFDFGPFGERMRELGSEPVVLIAFAQ